MAEVKKAMISPSILAADFAKLGEDVADVCRCGIDYLHIDVMDGMFVPNISFGADVMKSLKDHTTVPYDVHLMILDPDRYIEKFVTDNTEFITVHYEACDDLKHTLDHIHSLGVKAGVSVKPKTAPEVLDEYLDDIDLILVMSVEPGFGGQSFMADMLPKVGIIKEYALSHGKEIVIEADGGINAETIEMCREAGIDVAVSGTGVFKAEDAAAAIEQLKNG